MRRGEIMIVAGDPSGDANAADLVRALTLEIGTAPIFFGAGGPRMREAGVELAFDLTGQSIIGLDFLSTLPRRLRQLQELVRLAVARKPDAVILVDNAGFSLRVARAIRQRVRASTDWTPKIVQFTSPQVWASRPGRAKDMARDYDLVLSLFAFEKDWYAKRVPELKVEFVGNPIFDRLPKKANEGRKRPDVPTVLFLPGSRRAELNRHLPVLLKTADRIAASQPAKFEMVVPPHLAEAARRMLANARTHVELRPGEISEALASADLAITKSGTITLECAYYGVPAIVMYKAAYLTYFLGRQIISVKYLAMPNLLADEAIYPEFIQGQATPANLSEAALELLSNDQRREEVRAKLAKIMATLGGPGAARRAAAAIVKVMRED